ncbi:MFS transporter [Paracidovorax wautersii]|uniref:MFS transporter n=1 Tax=Paracidovorax wautersii TaxID=1177982 RepID=UPI0031E427BA
MTTDAAARAPGRPTGLGTLCVALAGIYTVQSLVTGLATQALPAVLRSAGASLQMTGLAFLVLAPWVLKGLWAPWVERWRLPAGRSERRSRALILAGQALVVALLAALAAMGSGPASTGTWDASRLGPLMVLLTLAALATATVDIAADGFAIDQLAPHQRGWGNVAQVGGSYLGIALGGSAFLLLFEHAGWAAATAALALLTAAFTLPLWRLREPARPATDAAARPHRATWRHAWQRPALRWGLLLVFGLGLGVRLCLGMLGPWLLDEGVGMAQLAALWGLGGLCAGLAGTLAGGLLVQCAGAWRALHAALALEAVALVVLAICAALHPPVAWLLGASALLLAAMAGGFVARYAWLMGLTSPRQPGLDFTLLQCTDAAVALAGGVAGGWLAGHAGHAASFAVAASCGVLALALPALIGRRSNAPDAPGGAERR